MNRGHRRFLSAGRIALFFVIGLQSLACSQTRPAGDLTANEKLFQTPPDDCRMMVRWWWFGPTVTKPEISRELHAMKDAGIGGVEIATVYPLVLDDPSVGFKTLPYLSDEHLDALRYANEEARSLGMRVDLTLCSGWPYGGPTVPIEQAAGQLRITHVALRGGEQSVTLPRLAGGETLIAAFLTKRTADGCIPEKTQELTETKDGAVALPKEKSDADEVLFFISSRTRMMVKRPAVGAEGYVLDHYDRAALDAYLQKVGDRLIGAFGDKPPYAIFCDSLEVYNTNWTPDLLAEFQKRRGYDLKPFLPALNGEFGPHTADIRHDWGQTLTEVFDEHFVQPLRQWAADHHTRLRMQAYGTPPASLFTNQFIDLPEGEGFRWRTLSATRWASSANHLLGNGVTSSETFTWTHSPAFRSTPLDLKAEADLHFLEGINQIIGHGWPYSAPQVAYPGWRFYAAGALDDKNPWWIVMPDVTAYLQRMSYLLRQGTPANDVAIYLPNSDAWAHLGESRSSMLDALHRRIGDQVVSATLDAGHNFDFIDDDAMRSLGKVNNGTLTIGAGQYKAIILPNVETIPPDTMRQLADFAKSGGVLIATRRLPERAPGFNATDADQSAVHDTATGVFSAAGAPGHFIPDEQQLTQQLRMLLPLDADFSTARSELGFVHRRLSDGDLYFIVNTSSATQSVDAHFAATTSSAQSWDPCSGTIQSTPLTPGNGIHLDLEPYESRVIVFTKQATPQTSPHTSPTTAAAPVDLSTDWQVTLADKPPTTMPTLKSWADDPAGRFYSGVATYEKHFDLAKDALSPGNHLSLDFGPSRPLPTRMGGNGMHAAIDPPIREVAVVYINGQRAGSLWHPPYRLDVTAYLHPGANEIKLLVANTAINSLAGQKQPDYRALTEKYGERFTAQDMNNLQPLPSGVIGIVRLVGEQQ